MSRNPYENALGYKILEAVSFDGKRGFVLAHDPQAPFPMATFQFAEENGRREYFRGHYYLEKDADVARLDFAERVRTHKSKYPGAAEKYNHLAAAEMSDEDNYNQIDGVPNNTTKPSILEQLRELQHKAAETASNTPGRPPEMER